MVAGRKHKLRDKQSDTEPSPQQTQPRPCHRCSDYRRCSRFRTCLITRCQECVLAAESTLLKAVRDRKALPKQSKRQDTTNQPTSSSNLRRGNNNIPSLSAHLCRLDRINIQTRLVRPCPSGAHVQAVAQCQYARSARLGLTYRPPNIHVRRRHSQHANQRAP